MKKVLNKLISKMCGCEQIINQQKKEIDRYRSWVPPGHFYSPIPLVEEIRQRESEVFVYPETLHGIDLNEEQQLDLFSTFKRFYNEIPFTDAKKDNLRYFFENDNFSYFDAISLYCMIRHLKPNKIIEVGSGYSSCVTLDTNDVCFNNSISCTFIEPYPELLYSLINKEDIENVEIIPNKLQDVKIDKFLGLSENDILFIDSTHVSKTGSDVNYIFFEILPQINSGVYIHIHDIFYPFEYTKEWVYQGRAWNEAYMLRTFLQYNNFFQIVFFNSFISKRHKDKLSKYMPLALKNEGGSIWIRKL